MVGPVKVAGTEDAMRRIRVVSAGPGLVATPLVSGSREEAAPQAIGELDAMKRMGRQEDVAALVCCLASDAASSIAGSYRLAAGGCTAR